METTNRQFKIGLIAWLLVILMVVGFVVYEAITNDDFYLIRLNPPLGEAIPHDLENK